MEQNRLRQHLLNEYTRLYCVLDGAAVPDLPLRLYEFKARNYCLLPGELSADMQYLAPYLVHLPTDSDLTNWVFENFSSAADRGIFIHAGASMIDLRGHLTSLTNVYDEDARSLIFRYYDPRVLRTFLPTCNAAELKAFFGKIERFFAETGDGSGLISYRLEGDELKQTRLE